MKLTRNLYDCDEVCLSIMWSIVHEQRYQTAFWVQELIDSHYHRDLIRVLFRTWIWHAISSDPKWIDYLRNETDLSDLPNYHLLSQSLIDAICSRGIDHRLWTTLVIGGYLTKDSGGGGDGGDGGGVDHIDDVTLDTILQLTYHGSILDAWLIMCNDMVSSYNLLSEHGIDMIKDFDIYIDSDSDTSFENQTKIHWNIIVLCAIIVRTYAIELEKSYTNIKKFSTETEDKILTYPVLSDDIAGYINNIKTLNGKQRRIYSIPVECLYGQCARGLMYNQTHRLHVLYDIYKTLESEQQGSFWYNNEQIAIYSNDVSNEEFHMQYFPDDIPDEWSREDQLKSHGYGVYETSDVPVITLEKMASIWFPDVIPVAPPVGIILSFDEIAELYCDETGDEYAANELVTLMTTMGMN